MRARPKSLNKRVSLYDNLKETFVYDREHSSYTIEEQYICHVFQYMRLFEDISQKELALSLGISQGTISKIENRKALPDVMAVLNISSILKFSLEIFIMKAR